MTTVSLTYLGTDLQFTAHAPHGVDYTIDGDAKIGPSPMVMLLHSLVSCSAIDVVHILKKMRLPLDSLRVEVDGTREDGAGARKWTDMHMRFYLEGEIPPVKAQRAADLSIEKYCSAYRQLESTANITYEVTLNGEKVG